MANAYNSIAGVDIKAVLGNTVLKTLQGISYSVVREKVPTHVMGSPNSQGFSRGKRAIAGSLIFLMTKDHPILGSLSDTETGPAKDPIFNYYADKDEPNINGQTRLKQTETADLSAGGISGASLSNIAGDFWGPRQVDYVDQILPFDIVLVGANEYGNKAAMRLIGTELLNEGYGISIDDVVSESQYTFVTRHVAGWRSVSTNTNLLGLN